MALHKKQGSMEYKDREPHPWNRFVASFLTTTTTPAMLQSQASWVGYINPHCPFYSIWGHVISILQKIRFSHTKSSL